MTLQSNRLPLTPDLLSERLQRLKSDFPDLFTAEGSLDRDALQTLTSEKPDHREHYRFEWAGKHESKRLAFTPSTARLQYDDSRSVNSDNAKWNMIIEWDNLEVLKLLMSGYRGAMKCIYIDPPYNTGKDFVYSDNYTEWRTAYWDKSGQVEDGVRVDTNSESAGRYHSDWLSMMHSRLLLARGLLRDDWVIFISIDDHEVHNLRKLMDEVFGEENFIGDIIWNSTKSVTNTALISVSHTYNLIYAKSIDHYTENRHEFRLPENGEGFSNPDNDIRWPWKADPFQVWGWRPNQQYDIINPKTWQIYKPNPNSSWKNDFEKFWELMKDNRILFWVNGEAGPQRKRFLSEALERWKVTKTLWDDVDTTTNATRDLKNLFWGIYFDTPKPVGLIKRFLQLSTKSDDLILDFFWGSGTTGQAVMELNREDGGNRQYILVQLPELTDEKSEAYKAGYKRISDITIERNRRVIERIDPESSSGWQKNLGWQKPGFRVLTLARSAFPRVDFVSDPDKTEEENLAALDDYIARKEAVFNLETHVPGVMEEVLLKNGFRLDYMLTPVAGITTNLVYLATDSTGLSAYITLDRPIRSETISYFQSHTEQRFICLEQSLDTTAKWNLRTALGELFVAY